MRTSREGGGNVYKVYAVCPDCGHGRWIQEWCPTRENYTGRCKKCASAYSAILKSIRSNASVRTHLLTSYLAPCGRLIVPVMTTEVGERRVDMAYWKGRCSLEATNECRHYETCLDMAVENGWPGWRVKS